MGGVLTTPVIPTIKPSIHPSIPPSGGGRVEKVSEEFLKKRIGESGVVRDSAPRSSDGMAPPSNATPMYFGEG